MRGDYSPIGGVRPRLPAATRVARPASARGQDCGRQYFCRRCRSRVLICSHCDRGHRYCTRDCATLSRRDAQQRAGQRYQDSRRGRLAHADRQRRYRARTKKVTHTGSPPSPTDGLLLADPMVAENRSLTSGVRRPVQCHWCERQCSERVRLDFLRRRGVQRHIHGGESRNDHPP